MVRQLTLRDLEFPFFWAECLAGNARYYRLVRYGMPKLPPNVIKCVFYLYENEEAANSGVDPGGTGFFLAVPIRGSYRWEAHVYAVTNWHVACDDSDPLSPPCPAIRLNGRDGSPVVLPFGSRDWHFIPGGVDVAIAPISDPEGYDILAVPYHMSVDRGDIVKGRIGVGDDVFMMGLFVDHYGGPRNVPAARFGNISMTPNRHAPVPQPNLGEGEAFVLDLHSRTGFSGSPVFVYRTFGSDLTASVKNHFRVEFDERRRNPVSLNVEFENIFKFLGVHFAQFPEELEGRDGTQITGLSGMTCAVPAWNLLKLLNLPELVTLREEEEERMAKKKEKLPKPEKAHPKSGEAPKATDAERFKRLLAEAVKRPKSSDQT